jgi:beta-galactosidase
MRKIILVISILNVVCFQAQAQERTVQLLDTSWRFVNHDINIATLNQLDDATWQQINVPHDWAIMGNFDMNIDKQAVQVVEDGEKTAKLRTGRTGALPCFGVGWYRRALPVSKADEGKRIFIEFDGSMSRTKVYVNGQYVGEWPYGYSSFSLEITKFIQFGKENTLSVRLENKTESSRWYPGAGIYRNVRLVKTATARIAQWGTYITTPTISEKTGEVNIKTTIDADTKDPSVLKLITDVFDASGKKVGTVSSEKKKDGTMIFDQTLKIRTPQYWRLARHKWMNTRQNLVSEPFVLTKTKVSS